MIIDRTWNKKEQKLTISYVDKLGKRQFYQKSCQLYAVDEFFMSLVAFIQIIDSGLGNHKNFIYTNTISYTIKCL